MENRIKAVVADVLDKLAQMGVIKTSQINPVLHNFTLQALQEAMRQQALSFEDVRGK